MGPGQLLPRLEFSQKCIGRVSWSRLPAASAGRPAELPLRWPRHAPVHVRGYLHVLAAPSQPPEVAHPACERNRFSRENTSFSLLFTCSRPRGVTRQRQPVAACSGL